MPSRKRPKHSSQALDPAKQAKFGQHDHTAEIQARTLRAEARLGFELAIKGIEAAAEAAHGSLYRPASQEPIVKALVHRLTLVPPAIKRKRGRVGSAKEQSPGFQHAPNYAWVSWNGEDFTFTPQQRIVVKQLHEAHMRGEPDVSTRVLLVAIGRHDKKAKLRDTFRKGISYHPAFAIQGDDDSKKLIVSHSRGFYRVNLD